MPKPKSFDTYYDLSSGDIGIQDTNDDYVNVKAGKHMQGDVHEQLAELEYIYVNKTDSLIGYDDYATTARPPITLGDVFEGVAQLATMGVVEVTDIVEAIHREIILRPLGRFNDRHLNKWQRGITGRIYGTIRQAMLVVGSNLTTGLWLYNSMTKQKQVQQLPRSLRRLVNILNGVMGDHLVNHKNPLAISMAFYDRYNCPQHEEVSGRVIILCHGLCMSHLSWNVAKGHSLGERIVHSELDATILYLNYNTGRRISSNGRNLSIVIQELVDNNPDITQIDLIGHSMGGLVSRSALFYSKQQGFNWIQRVGNLITLGTPHHGASLERIGYFVQGMIAKLPFAGSLAKLGDLRSAGIIDLRHGSIRDADWQALEGRDVLPPEFRHPTPLPLHVHSHFVAATLVEALYHSKATSLLGDGLVTVESALGEYDDVHSLIVPEERKAIFYGVSHYELLYNDRVHKQVIKWLVANGQNDYSLSSRIYSYPGDLDVVV